MFSVSTLVNTEYIVILLLLDSFYPKAQPCHLKSRLTNTFWTIIVVVVAACPSMTIYRFVSAYQWCAHSRVQQAEMRTNAVQGSGSNLCSNLWLLLADRWPWLHLLNDDNILYSPYDDNIIKPWTVATWRENVSAMANLLFYNHHRIISGWQCRKFCVDPSSVGGHINMGARFASSSIFIHEISSCLISSEELIIITYKVEMMLNYIMKTLLSYVSSACYNFRKGGTNPTARLLTLLNNVIRSYRKLIII